MANDLEYQSTDEYPSATLEWKDANDAIIDFSSGYTFTAQLVLDGVAYLTKTSGITGAATSPNVTVAWSTGQLNLPANTYDLVVTARDGAGKDRTFRPGNPPKVQILLAPGAVNPAVVGTSYLLNAANLFDVPDPAAGLANLGGITSAASQALVDTSAALKVSKATTQAGTTLAPTATTLLSFQPTDVAKAPFSLYFAGGSFAGTWDTVMYFGYNADRANAAEPSARFAIEQDYLTGGQHLVEAYLELATGPTDTGNVRPFFASMDRTTGATTVAVTSTDFSVNAITTNVQGFGVTHASREIDFGPFTGGTPRYKFRCPAGYNTLIDLQSNGLDKGQIGVYDNEVELTFGGHTGFAWGVSGSAATISFFGGTLRTQETGVAVTIAAVHAALVRLNVFTA